MHMLISPYIHRLSVGYLPLSPSTVFTSPLKPCAAYLTEGLES